MNPLGGSVLTDYQHVGMVGNRLKGRRLRRNLASVASGAHKIHGLEDDRSLGGIVNLQGDGEKENYFENAGPDVWRLLIYGFRGTNIRLSNRFDRASIDRSATKIATLADLQDLNSFFISSFFNLRQNLSSYSETADSSYWPRNEKSVNPFPNVHRFKHRIA